MQINESFGKLTDRETVILIELSKGHANKEIADNLAIAVPTVRTHLRRIYEKIHVRSRTEAIVKYLAATPFDSNRVERAAEMTS